MALFESLIALLFVAAFLLAGSRRLGVPYPTLLALAGAMATLLPFAPVVAIDPHLALAVFIAPALLDAAYDTAPTDLRRLWIPLLFLAVGAVLATTATVAMAGWLVGGLPLAAAVALGAIVSPPDAVAANAVIGQLGFPRSSSLVLRGESLLNDATALILFDGAVALAMNQAPQGGAVGLAAAVPGGILLGLALGWIYARVSPIFAGTLSGVVTQFTATFGVWLVADRLHVSPVLAVIAYAMYMARAAQRRTTARDRVRSYAVWAVMVFGLNVLAFLLMGLQVRPLLARLHGDTAHAIGFALLILAIVIATRFLSLFGYRAAMGLLWRRRRPVWQVEPAPWRITFLVSWCGMRGLLTLATAFALPAGFPGRDLIMLTAMGVVLGTLVLQGLTLRPLMHLLGITGSDDSLREELSEARRRMLEAGIAAADRESPKKAAALRARLGAAIDMTDTDDPQGRTRHDEAMDRVVAAQRNLIVALRAKGELADDVFYRLEEELDWMELATKPDEVFEVVDA